MKWTRYLKGKLSIRYCPYNQWYLIGIDKYWSDRLIYFNFSKISIILDCRINWIDDMITGKPK